ncbi:MAG: glucoamylase family protein, partial [Planctomycetota bacterium]
MRASIFTIEQLELHAKALAAIHRLGHRRGGNWLLRRLADSERVIGQCHDLASETHAAGQRLTPAAEWLLDNHYLIGEQVHLAREHFPPGYSRNLPALAGGKTEGLPRIYDAILELVSHLDGRVDEESLSRYIAAYQSVTHLTLGELWSVAIMLRLTLIENLRRLSSSISAQQAHRDRALAWARRISAPGEGHENALLTLADMVRENPPLTTAFVAQFNQALQGCGWTSNFVLAWLEQRLSEQGQTIENIVRAESQSQAADQTSMSNSIAGLRFVNATEWHRFVETHSVTEQILRSEPAGVYARMDFATRDEYRHVVEATARRLRLDEEVVARTAVTLAAARHAEGSDAAAAHVGYVLVDEGRPDLDRTLRGPEAPRLVPRRLGRGLTLALFLGSILAATVLVASWLVRVPGQGSDPAWPALALGAALAASQLAVAVVNWFVSLARKPRGLPRMDFERGIPDECRTIVVVPSLLSGTGRVAELLEGLELRYLANRDPNLWFALLTDFCDADQEREEDDVALLEQAADGIDALNAKYGSGAHGRFLLFHRPRIHNPQEGCWMGRERKRGKIEDFNSLLGGEGRDRFSRIVGDTSSLASIRYVITLDTDTDLPWGAGWRLVGAAAHPLNRAKLDPDGQRLVRGYAILQPRVSTTLRSAQRSVYARLMGGEPGLDPYTRLVSDVYQDLFAEASFIGKGLYDVDVFRRLLHGRFPDNALLSHDMLESCYARTAQCSDVELFEDSPSRYLEDARRRHRWMRGDWQIAPWLGPRVRDAGHWPVFPHITALGRWKIIDNLRRALVAPACTALLVAGWVALPAPLPWTLAVLSLLLVPEVLPALAELAQRPSRYPLRLHLLTVSRSTARRLARIALWVTFLPFETALTLDAAARTLWRMLVSRRRLLEWQTAAAAERGATTGIGGVLLRMWQGPFLAATVAVAVIVLGTPGAATAAIPVLLPWLLSPLAAWWISRSQSPGLARLGEEDARFLRQVARLTWRYFETFVGPQENWLPPDNVQETPDRRVAHRVSPTDMGLALLSNLSAYDMGYLSGGQLLDRVAHSIESLEQLERHRGHFFNWYDTLTRKALPPLYVSSVDSGNLVGQLWVLCRGMLELPAGPVVPAGATEGMRDTLRILAGQLDPPAESPAGRASLLVRCDRTALASVARLLQHPPGGLAATAAWLTGLGTESLRLASSIDSMRHPEASWWAHALERQVRSFLEDLTEMAPWLAVRVGPADRRRVEEIDRARSLRDLVPLAQRAAEAARTAPNDGMAEAFRLGAERISARLRQVDALAQRCSGLADADFSFLYDPRRKLLSIGYWTSERRLDNSFYDLLASEARLASYVAIASGQLPVDHWFALGRRLTTTGGGPVLLSWSGSMFEYLMPLLVMPALEGTLLDETCRAAVARQAEYGRQRGVPWGISESCYNMTNVEGSYQYRAFGVPGLGLQRGLAEDVVVSPYASTLALMVDARGAVANLRRMADESVLGPYGFYEAVDYTPSRVPAGERKAVVRTCMAHHHGMSLLALAQTVTGPRMQRRFLSHPDFRAASLLLQERVPRTEVLTHVHAREVRESRRFEGRAAEPAVRVFTSPNTPIPEVHLLSNGRYHVMVSASGGGYSRWNELAITRWREDPTTTPFGVFCYVGDPQTRQTWSSSFQPTLRAGDRYEAVFTPGRAEFRRLDDQIETHTEIAVSMEDDVEIRRIRLTNRSEAHRSLQLTAFAEVVLAPGSTDELHRAFSNLFVHTEVVPDLGAILVSRRARSAEERPPWMFCMMRTAAGEAGPCSYETDRARFIGRGRSVRQPAALEDWGPLSGTAGAVLDPCAALRRTVNLPSDGAARIDVVLGAAPTREAALALAVKYQGHHMADRVFGVAATYSRAVVSYPGATETEIQRYEQAASAAIFPIGAFRAPGTILRRNRKGQSGLWEYSISGDLPIVLLRVSHADNLSLVRDLLRMHAYWRMMGLVTDLVIWNEDVSGYRRELNDKILDLIASGTEAHLAEKPGGIFVRHIDTFPEENRVLLQAVARIVIHDVGGPLDQQLDRWRLASVPSKGAMLPPRLPAEPESPAHPLRRDLAFFNGTGGFTRDGREYIIDLPPGRPTPAPWVNVIANPRLGTVVSESGSAYTWYGNAQLGRLTPWNNDPVGDPSGELLFVRDDASGSFFSPTPWPRAPGPGYACRHGFGYSVFEHREDQLETELTTFVEVEAPVKFLVLKIRNLAPRSRVVSVFASVDLVLGDIRPRHAMHVVTELEPLTGAILAHNSYATEFSDVVAFFDASDTERSVSGDRAEFLGRNGDPSQPAALRLRRLSGRLGPGLDPCAAMQVQVELPEGAEREVVFTLGAGKGVAEAVSLIQGHRGSAAAHVALRKVWEFWNDKLGVLFAETPDPAANVIMNGWLPYQALSCRLWGRSGFYQSGGAYGFRDQLQDCVALLHEVPDLCRQHLLRCAGRQFVEGDVQHWWHPPGGRGVRTRCSDDFLWLPYAVCRYVAFTGDTGVLDEQVPYLAGRALNQGEDSYYDLPGRSDQVGSLYEHCTRAVLRGLKLGPRGLPLMGGGDWNDGMNRVGHLGQGESVWLAFFLHEVLAQFAGLAERVGDEAFAGPCRSAAGKLAGRIEEEAWDGQWYLRGTFDSGEPLGSARNAECRIDLLPQSWAT